MYCLHANSRECQCEYFKKTVAGKLKHFVASCILRQCESVQRRATKRERNAAPAAAKPGKIVTIAAAAAAIFRHPAAITWERVC